jgi:hypothetical protein
MPGAPSFAPLFHAKGGGLDARCDNRSVELLPRVLVRRCRGSPPTLNKYLYRTCPSQLVQVLRDFGQAVLVLDQICPVEQLFSARLRATFERKLKYETVHRTVHPESLPAAGSKGLPGAESLPAAGSKGVP